jgi:hypothetical protein
MYDAGSFIRDETHRQSLDTNELIENRRCVYFALLIVLHIVNCFA